MKLTATLSTIALTAVMTLPATANAQTKMSEYMRSALIDVCKSVQSNRPYKLKNTLKEHRLDIPTINQKLVCNDESPYNFALTHNASRTAATLNKGQVKIQDIAYNGSKYYIYVE